MPGVKVSAAAPGTMTAPISSVRQQRVLEVGEGDHELCDNAVYTAKYNIFTFLPIGLREQFRRIANVYFLCMGGIMALGYYTDLFDSAITPWTTLGPLAFVVCISLLQEGAADLKRHSSDHDSNNYPCRVLRVVEDNDDGNNDYEADAGDLDQIFEVSVYIIKEGIESDEEAVAPSTTVKKVKVKVHTIKRMDIRAGDVVVCQNRDMVPVDLVLLGSSAERGSAYIETSSIDGETNLKLRLCSGWNSAINEQESLQDAISRIVQSSKLGNPNGSSATSLQSAIEGDANDNSDVQDNTGRSRKSLMKQASKLLSSMKMMVTSPDNQDMEDEDDSSVTEGYFGILSCESPNKSINTFNGKLTLPPAPSTLSTNGDNPLVSSTIPLNAENMLLRGAVLRNTEWVVGIAAYTGEDTKLVQNSFATPSKFSRLDSLSNRVIIYILITMALVTMFLGVASNVVTEQNKDKLWYIGYLSSESMYNGNGDSGSSPWPYFTEEATQDLPDPDWDEESENVIQMWLLYITLLNNFVPLSLYVTLEIITFSLMFFINNDVRMYHSRTDTPASARSTIVSDLGQVEYIFSDKTGTLTQNVMRFKRASVDGMVFGAPVTKETAASRSSFKSSEPEIQKTPHHPLKALLYSSANRKSVRSSTAGLSGLTSFNDPSSEHLTFNAEMFIRVLSICHTVVVEKEMTGDARNSSALVDEVLTPSSSHPTSPRARLDTADMFDPDLTGKDGAPSGFVYQAESPDEGALVSGAATIFGHQLVSRNASGVTVRVRSPSIFQDARIVKNLKKGKLNEKELAAKVNSFEVEGELNAGDSYPREENWKILAVNKFDSTRKRMSVLVRSPENLGGIPMILCKGADSAMLKPGVCSESISAILNDGVEDGLLSKSDDWELGTILGIQSHLGEFASEGLRTLVLGIRILNDRDCEDLLSKHAAASSSIKDRDEKLTDVANLMESNLMIVGATAIEDKLQKGVPDTIAKLAKAGIKLWVCTGDKRETAIEIGYSTKVLSPNMSLFVLKDEPDPERLRIKLCMEFVRMIKSGKLPQYSRRQFEVDKTEENDAQASSMAFIKQSYNHFILWCSAIYKVYLRPVLTCGCKSSPLQDNNEMTTDSVMIMDDPVQRRKAVREMALNVLRNYLASGASPNDDQSEGIDENIEVVASSSVDDGDDSSSIFRRSTLAKEKIRKSIDSGNLTGNVARSEQLARSSSMSVASYQSLPLNADELSLISFLPNDAGDRAMFDPNKRTILEKLFASDADVRLGFLGKHLKSTPQNGEIQIEENYGDTLRSMESSRTKGSRALIIEGHALDKLLGDVPNPIIEEILFSVASSCDAVIACRVSPGQKAEIVKLVRTYVSPEPVTLAIGDGANDVGMIQEAHVGVGISGLEGQQAVNASDFAIAQFRYLEELLLVHGRWNFTRMSKVVLFSFYKNAVLVGILVIYATRTLYSGTPLFDQWVYSMFNFVCTWPILFTGVFDRDLERYYVKENPQVYASGPRNEDLSPRLALRWSLLTFLHAFILYFFSAPSLISSGGYTSAFHGLMKGRSVVGDGEGGDLKVLGTTIYTALVFHLVYKALIETKSIIVGKIPPCVKCVRNKETLDKHEGYFSRMSYTFVGISVGSIIFYLWFLYTYEAVAVNVTDPTITPFVGVATHTLNTRSITWMIVFLAPVTALMIDVALKLFSNMYYPSQTQIHMEIAARERKGKAAVGFDLLPQRVQIT